MARQFGASWWGKAWVEALEGRAIRTDEAGGRMSRGRTYARKGRVTATEVLPGRVAGRVEGTEEYTADVTVKQFTDQQWGQLIDLIVDRAAHAAALLTGELPPALRDEAQAVGIDLLPGSGELLPDCSCPDWGDPCKHAAAMCYLITDLIDKDPFILLLLRGRSRDTLLDEIRSRRAAKVTSSSPSGADEEAAAEPGLDAHEAFNRPVGQLKAPSAPSRAGRPVSIIHHPPADSGIDLDALRMLIMDASGRAVSFLAGDHPSGLAASARADGARRAASIATRRPSVRPGTADDTPLITIAELADRLGLETQQLAADALAWERGGAGGLEVAMESWRPAPELLARGKAVLGPRARTSANTVSAGGVQLRLDRRKLWWRFEPNELLGWVLVTGGFEDPADALPDSELPDSEFPD